MGFRLAAYAVCNAHAVAFPPWFLRRAGCDDLAFAEQMAHLVSAQKATAAWILDRKRQEALPHARELAGQVAAAPIREVNCSEYSIDGPGELAEYSATLRKRVLMQRSHYRGMSIVCCTALAVAGIASGEAHAAEGFPPTYKCKSMKFDAAKKTVTGKEYCAAEFGARGEGNYSDETVGFRFALNDNVGVARFDYYCKKVNAYTPDRVTGGECAAPMAVIGRCDKIVFDGKEKLAVGRGCEFSGINAGQAEIRGNISILNPNSGRRGKRQFLCH
ncbi:hypothetical protein [Nocardia sp. XZ_19_369]|uniref:hypothetical protein n=1 Tax=Nocardia sp. XZ_19_369 TaxID=2769487 RepID=UPI00188EDDD3|nr:hypothetical protein [Nocardia sp. XZ_19_369]